MIELLDDGVDIEFEGEVRVDSHALGINLYLKLSHSKYYSFAMWPHTLSLLSRDLPVACYRDDDTVFFG